MLLEIPAEYCNLLEKFGREELFDVLRIQQTGKTPRLNCLPTTFI